MSKKVCIGLCLVVIVGVFAIINYKGPTRRVILYNIMHDEQEIQTLMDMSVSYIDQNGIHIDEIRYDGSKTLIDEKQSQDEMNQEIVHLYMDISTDFFGVSGGWGENMTYKDYEIVFSKNNEGQWEIIKIGYA